MNFLWEGLNPIYLLPAIILVIYLHIVGLAANKKIGTTIPSILMGFLVSLVFSSPFILPAHWGVIDYSMTLFIIPNIIVMIISILLIIRFNISVKLNQKIIFISLFTYFISLVYFKTLPGTLHDYWLYGDWFSSGSNFDYNSVSNNRNYLYGLTIMYTWLGSYSGLINGSSAQVAVGGIHLEWQTIATMLWISINMQILIRIAPKIKYKTLILSITFAALISTTNSLFAFGFYGSFSLFWIFLIIITTKQNPMRNTIILSFGFLFMVSSTIVVFPLILSTHLVWFGKINHLPRKLANMTWIITPLTMIIIIMLSFVGYDDYERSELIHYILRQLLVYLSAGIILLYGSAKLKNVVLINTALSLIANLLLNYNWNLLLYEKMPGVVMHRYLSFMLGHERSSVLITILTFPWAMHLLYENFKVKKDLK